MIKQNGYLENLLVFKTHSVQISAYSNTWTAVTEFLTEFLFFQGSHFVCMGEGRVVVMVVCGGGSVGVLMRFVWRLLGVQMGLLGGSGVGVGVCLGCGWAGE